MSDNRPIGVFDSGLGGLTVVRELVKLMPNEDIVYFGDTGRVPYGTKSNETIIKYTKQDENFLLSRGVKLIVAACGTVSSVAYSTKELLPVPFVEVVSHAAKRAVEATKNKKVGVIGTPATVKSDSYKKRMLALCPDVEVYQEPCPILVPLVEAGWIDRNDPVTVASVARYLKPLKEKNVDVLIMGCTHYPVLTNIIGDYMGEGVTLVNTGEYTAKAVLEYMNENDMLNNKTTLGVRNYFVSDTTTAFSTTASILLGHDVKGSVERVDIEAVGELD